MIFTIIRLPKMRKFVKQLQVFYIFLVKGLKTFYDKWFSTFHILHLKTQRSAGPAVAEIRMCCSVIMA